MQPDSSDAEIRAVARLPNLDIEIRHRPPRDGEGEQILISLKAMPSLEAFGRFLGAASPLVFWAGLMQMAWSPWITGFLPAPPKKYLPHNKK